MNKFEDIRGVAFDLDGTLVDSAPWLGYRSRYGALCAGVARRR